MFSRVTRVLMALVIALATTMPISVHAMSMPCAANGTAAHNPCPSCPQHPSTGDMNPDKMPACQILVCAGPLAMLPTPVMAYEHAFFPVAYVTAPPVHWNDAGPAPDPFPPRPIVLL